MASVTISGLSLSTSPKAVPSSTSNASEGIE